MLVCLAQIMSRLDTDSRSNFTLFSLRHIGWCTVEDRTGG